MITKDKKLYNFDYQPPIMGIRPQNMAQNFKDKL